MMMIDVLFSFWAVALGMSLLLDPDSEAATLDPLTYLAFVQGILGAAHSNKPVRSVIQSTRGRVSAAQSAGT